MKKLLFSILLVSLVFSCAKENEISTTESINEYSNLVFIDEFENHLVIDTLDKSKIANFSPLYFGKIKDSIKINYNNAKKGFTRLNWDKYKYPKVDDLLIFIDTSIHIGSPNNFNTWLISDTKKSLKHNALSYPVILKNISNDTLNIGFGDFLNIMSETQDSLGVWRENKKQFIYMCGTGMSIMILPPNEIAITSIKKGYGRQKSKLRIKLIGNEEHIFSNKIKIFNKE